MLAVLRRMDGAGYSSESFLALKGKLAERYKEYLKDRPEGTELGEWVSAYHELSLLDLVHNCYRVVHLLFALLVRQKSELKPG